MVPFSLVLPLEIHTLRRGSVKAEKNLLIDFSVFKKDSTKKAGLSKCLAHSNISI